MRSKSKSLSTPRQTISLRLPPKMLEDYGRVAKLIGSNRNQLIERALAKFSDGQLIFQQKK